MRPSTTEKKKTSATERDLLSIIENHEFDNRQKLAIFRDKMASLTKNQMHSISPETLVRAYKTSGIKTEGFFDTSYNVNDNKMVEVGKDILINRNFSEEQANAIIKLTSDYGEINARNLRKALKEHVRDLKNDSKDNSFSNEISLLNPKNGLYPRTPDKAANNSYEKASPELESRNYLPTLPSSGLNDTSRTNDVRTLFLPKSEEKTTRPMVMAPSASAPIFPTYLQNLQNQSRPQSAISRPVTANKDDFEIYKQKLDLLIQAFGGINSAYHSSNGVKLDTLINYLAQKIAPNIRQMPLSENFVNEQISKSSIREPNISLTNPLYLDKISGRQLSDFLIDSIDFIYKNPDHQNVKQFWESMGTAEQNPARLSFYQTKQRPQTSRPVFFNDPLPNILTPRGSTPFDQQELSKTKQQITDLEKIISSQKQELEKKQKELLEARQQLPNSQKIISDQQLKISEQQQQISAYQDSLSQAQTELSNLQKRPELFEATTQTEFEEKKKETVATNTDKSAQTDLLGSNITDFYQEITKVRKENSDLTSAQQNAEQTVKRFEDSLQQLRNERLEERRRQQEIIEAQQKSIEAIAEENKKLKDSLPKTNSIIFFPEKKPPQKKIKESETPTQRQVRKSFEFISNLVKQDLEDKEVIRSEISRYLTSGVDIASRREFIKTFIPSVILEGRNQNHSVNKFDAGERFGDNGHYIAEATHNFLLHKDVVVQLVDEITKRRQEILEAKLKKSGIKQETPSANPKVSPRTASTLQQSEQQVVQG